MTGALSAKDKWKLPGQGDPTVYMEEEIVGDPMWRQNYSTIKEHASRVLAVLDDQSSRGSDLECTRCGSTITVPSSRGCVSWGYAQGETGRSHQRKGAVRWLERHTREPAHTSPRSGALACGFRPQEIHDEEGQQRGADLFTDG